MADLKTFVLFALLAVVAALVGFIVGGGTGVLLGGAIVVVLTTVASNTSEAMVLHLQGAVPVTPRQAPDLHALVAHLAARAGIATPALYLSPSPTANAMAVQTRDTSRGALAVTRGALRLLSPTELEAVLAHEIAHLGHGDTRVLQLSTTVARAALTLLKVSTWLAVFVVLLTGGGVARAALLATLALVIPPVVTGLVSALSRTRELAADATAARLTGRPLALAQALAKLERHHQRWARGLLTDANRPAWLRSHPPTADRVDRLLAMASSR